MKKHIKSHILLAVLFLLTLNYSCKKILDEEVDNRTLLESLPDLEKALVALQPKANYLLTDYMTDDYEYRDIAGHVSRDLSNRLKPIFDFSILRKSLIKEELADDFSPYSTFKDNYFIINNTLLIIEKAKAYSPKNEEERQRLTNLIGKAIAVKAYCYFVLVNMFGAQYNAATAASDRTIPYIAEYSGEPIVNYNASNVAEVYKNVEADLLKSLTLMEDEFKIDKFGFNKYVVYALLSKIYLYKKDWSNCIKYANLLIQDKPNVLPGEDLRASITDAAQYSANYFNPANDSYLSMAATSKVYAANPYTGMYPTPLMNFFSKNGYDPENNMFIQTSPLYRDILGQKLVRFYYNGNNVNMPLFTVDEVYFNRAEAEIEQNGSMTAQAAQDLLLLAENQVMSVEQFNLVKNQQLKVGNSREASITALLDLKRVRFFSEGIRWFDLKRHKMPVKHSTTAGTFEISGQNANDYVIQMPPEESSLNKGL